MGEFPFTPKLSLKTCQHTAIINRSIMKFVALALAFLLAAGCQADAPSQYEHIRAGVVTYLTQVKETAHKTIAHLDDAEYKDYKARLTHGLDSIEALLKSATESLAPVREGIGPQIVEFIAGARDKVSKDLEELRKELEPKAEELREVVKKHLVEYHILQMGPQLLTQLLELLLQLPTFILLAQIGSDSINLLPVLLDMGSICGLQLLKNLG
ncbi:hypothetical protein PGIGA_G00125070 [Pangasianodon gigas]|uniref:Uncharacterized protein n=1 Tax=Pangasianodon gigas TaxID=30993 RepID=A0ACC5XH38_PANGG|nr:hypothetical protein [Pangasianodon gigas]